MRLPSTLVVAALLVASLGAAAVVPAPAAAQTDGHPCAGTTSEQPDELTVVSIQGAKFAPNDSKKTAARVVAFHPNGSIAWVHHNARQYGVVWSYDVDPLPNGNLFVTATKRVKEGEETKGKTLLYELDPETGKPLWSETLDMLDTHDADMLNRTHIVIANMRNYNESAERNDDRIAIYNRTSDEVEWSWYFRDHYDESVGGKYDEDWTHVNDVEKVGDRYILASPRNFDQTILVDRKTGDIEMKLGADGNYDVMKQQHNPDYLESESGDPTFLVADSENERLIEYEYADGEWNETWSVGSEETLNWPRDADRLPNGNTLIGDSKNDRVLEVTPEGEVVWEVYAPYLVYDVERVPGDESSGPTMADEGVNGHKDLSNAEPPSEDELEPCAQAISDHEGGFGEKLATGENGSDNGSSTSTEWADGTPEDDVITEKGDGSSVFSPLGPVVPLAALGAVVALFAVRARRD